MRRPIIHYQNGFMHSGCPFGCGHRESAQIVLAGPRSLRDQMKDVARASVGAAMRRHIEKHHKGGQRDGD